MGIRAEDMTDAAWDYVFMGTPYQAGTPVTEDKLTVMRGEFK